MDALPTELIEHLCSYLETTALCSFRLVCKAFAVVGEEHLFNNFEFRLLPNHHRLSSLEQLAANSSISARLRCISLESGVQLEYADYRYWHNQVYHAKKSSWERNLPAEGASKHEYSIFHETLEARFTTKLALKYDLYRRYLDQEASSMADEHVRDRLIRVFTNLNEVNHNFQLKLIMAEPQIQLEDLEAFDVESHHITSTAEVDPRRQVMNRRAHCLAHYISFFDAVRLSPCILKHFTAIDIPQQLLTSHYDDWESLKSVEYFFKPLEHIEMKISTFPVSDWLSRAGISERYRGGRSVAARRLRDLLNEPSNLCSLGLEFPSGQESEFSFEIFDSTNLDFFPRTWLHRLHSLRLCHFRCTWADMQCLLIEAVELETLTMKDCRLETGSIVDLLEFLRERKLPSVQLLGRWYVDEDCGEWHIHTKADFTDCTAATTFEGAYAEAGKRAELQGFIDGHNDCPLPRWTAEDDPPRAWDTLGDTSFHFIQGQPSS